MPNLLMWLESILRVCTMPCFVLFTVCVDHKFLIVFFNFAFFLSFYVSLVHNWKL